MKYFGERIKAAMTGKESYDFLYFVSVKSSQEYTQCTVVRSKLSRFNEM